MGGGNAIPCIHTQRRRRWVIVETAREALAKAADFLDDGQREVIFKDLLGNVLDRAVVVTMAGTED
jgi:hypothetical protein